MKAASFRIELLDQHGRTVFDCGSEPLNDYFRTRVSQDIKRRITACYVAIDVESSSVAGYYTLAATGVPLGDLPEEIIKRLPRYPTIPAVRVGRLAVDLRFQGHKLGGVLLFDAIQRTCRSGIAAYAVIVDAKDEKAVAFYRHHGFEPFRDAERTLFLPISEALKRLTDEP